MMQDHRVVKLPSLGKKGALGKAKETTPAETSPFRRAQKTFRDERQTPGKRPTYEQSILYPEKLIGKKGTNGRKAFV